MFKCKIIKNYPEITPVTTSYLDHCSCNVPMRGYCALEIEVK